MEFENKLVLITGSSRGIGKAIAYAFAQKGATVVLNSGHDKERLLKTYDAFINEGFKTYYFFGDLSDFDTAKTLFDELVTKYDKVPDILINNAGISYMGLFSDTTPQIWDNIIRTNLNTAYNCTYLCVPTMVHKHAGTIINISSIWGNVGASCEVAYSTSKAALNGFTKSLAKELGPSNIRVNSVACGWIDTDMTKCYTEEEKNGFIEEIPLCRTGQAEEVANACLFLASEKASYVTGQILTLDGGLL